MAQDPLSAAFRPLPPPETLAPRNPLRFAATFDSDGVLLAPFEESASPSVAASSSLSRVRRPLGRAISERFTSCSLEARVGDGLDPGIRGLTLADDHQAVPLVRGKTYKTPDPGSEWFRAPGKVRSDDWVEKEVARCVDEAESYVDLR